MMQRLTSRARSPEAAVDITLAGGSPWGFTLQGGSDFRSKLTVSKITPGGKADLSQSIAIGDEIVAINGIDCNSRAEAIELVRCSRQKLKLRLKREGSGGHLRQNGPSRKTSEPPPNLYHTAAKMHPSDFFSTFDVDRQKFANITKNLPNKKKPIYDSSDNLSASHEDLLESYRQSENHLRVSSMVEANERLSRSSTEIANGRASPEGDKLRRINSLSKVTGKSFHSSTGLLAASQHNRPGTQVYGRTWSLRRFVSLPEGHWPPLHERTLTSPGRIQRVMVKSTNIPTSAQKSPTGRESDNLDHSGPQSARSHNDWVGRWLMEEVSERQPQHQRSGSASSNMIRAADYKEAPDRRISLHERRDVRNSLSEQSHTLPRSKSFGGPTSYGVTVTTTALKRDESTAPPPRPPRSSLSNLMRDKPMRTGPVMETRYDSASARPLEMHLHENEPPRSALAYAAPGESQIEVRLPKDMGAPRKTLSESTSSLDSIGTADSSMGGGARRQGPAPPPRRSVSKLLSSFKTSGRRQVVDERGVQRSGDHVSRISELANQPKHTASRSWPTDHTLESKVTGSETRQSWHVEPAAMTAYNRREANTSGSSTSSDGTIERKLSKSSNARCSSSVMIRTMRSSSSSSVDEKNVGPTVYRSGQLGQLSSDARRTSSGQVRPELGQMSSDARPPSSSSLPRNSRPADFSAASAKQSGETRQAKTSRIEDTQILQQLMKSNASSAEPATNVKSMIQNFEGDMKHPTVNVPLQGEVRTRSHSFTQGKIEKDDSPPKAFPVTQSSSVDSLLSPEQRSPRRFDAMSRDKQDTSPFAYDNREAEVVNRAVREKPVDEPKWPSSNSFADDNRGAEVVNRAVREKPVEEPKWPSSNSFSSPEKSEKRRSLKVDVVVPPSLVERQQVVEEPVKKVEMSPRVHSQMSLGLEEVSPINGRLISAGSTTEVEKSSVELSTTEDLPSRSKEDDNDVFWDADDSLPPPPPLSSMDPLETSQDNLPLPSPPREVFVEFPPSYGVLNPVKEIPPWVGSRENVVEREVTSTVEASPETGAEPRRELNGREKSNASSLSEQTLETTTSSDLSSRDASPAESKTVGSKRSSPPPPLIITSTPTKEEPGGLDSNLNSSASPLGMGSNLSTPGSRPSSILSPKLEQLDKEKADLVESMNKKINDLRSQMNEIKDEIDANEALGQKVTRVVEGKTSASEFSKYQLFTGELNKIIGLLLSLTQRMHRYEMLLNDLDMSEEADRHQRDILLQKIDKVTTQHDEACNIKVVNDKRGENVSKFLENCLEEEEYADFQYYIDMKTQLALMHAEIRDKVKMGEERLNTLNTTKIDWSLLSFP